MQNRNFDGHSAIETKGGYMSTKITSWIEPAFWGLVVGAIGVWVTLAFGFGWMSAGNAAKMSAQKAQDAVVAYATPVCVARFEQQPNAVAAWQTLKKTEDWNRGDTIVKDGLVAEPDQKLDDNIANAVASNCAEKIMELKTLAGVQLDTKQPG